MLIGEGSRMVVHSIDAGTIRVDGGAMFGAVPKKLWNRQIEADDQNRIPLAMRCLLIETARERILVDTGAGWIEDEKVRDLYGIDNEGEPTRLETSLRAVGVEPSDVTIVVSTHLHFDHAGGHTVTEDGERRASFPNARYLVRRGEWTAAQADNLLLRESYHPDAFESLADLGVLELTEGDEEIASGVRLTSMPGHTEHHQGILMDLGEESVCYPCDLVPTAAHTRLTWIMAYDLEPMTTLAQKEEWLTRAAEEEWLLVFAHDPVIAAARAVPASDGVGCGLADLITDQDREFPRQERRDSNRNRI